jgi:hypothetical protein
MIEALDQLMIQTILAARERREKIDEAAVEAAKAYAAGRAAYMEAINQREAAPKVPPVG